MYNHKQPPKIKANQLKNIYNRSSFPKLFHRYIMIINKCREFELPLFITFYSATVLFRTPMLARANQISPMQQYVSSQRPEQSLFTAGFQLMKVCVVTPASFAMLSHVSPLTT